uniref:Uncharacterized protein n=1 Tax=Salmo trutta TaxID=8032 RepID=A0A674C735_SALTR
MVEALNGKLHVKTSYSHVESSISVTTGTTLIFILKKIFNLYLRYKVVFFKVAEIPCVSANNRALVTTLNIMTLLFDQISRTRDKTFPFAYSSLRLLITGPVSHYFYQPMVPTTVPYCIVKRLLLDRLIFAPAFLLVFFFCYEHPRADFQSKTPFQFININYVAVEFRVLK